MNEPSSPNQGHLMNGMYELGVSDTLTVTPTFQMLHMISSHQM